MIEISLNRQELMLQIQANPVDPELMQLYYCVDCRRCLASGGLFPALSHHGHALADLPGLDSCAPAEGHIGYWLKTNRADFDESDYARLFELSRTTNAGNWVWLLRGTMQQHWLTYLSRHIERLAEEWIMALNGQPSGTYPEPKSVWFREQPVQLVFKWQEDADIYQSLLNPINPVLV